MLLIETDSSHTYAFERNNQVLIHTIKSNILLTLSFSLAKINLYDMKTCHETKIVYEFSYLIYTNIVRLIILQMPLSIRLK